MIYLLNEWQVLDVVESVVARAISKRETTAVAVIEQRMATIGEKMRQHLISRSRKRLGESDKTGYRSAELLGCCVSLQGCIARRVVSRRLASVTTAAANIIFIPGSSRRRRLRLNVTLTLLPNKRLNWPSTLSVTRL